ncbi:YybS family protein [Aquibacillus saliphilus]|uniref:YybS family protein n=1 Tax=Aquibacillus saliphilus TaxID=1909422 RepID=UPI001CEFEE01|nr:YybS family protein [Aquibacillus saliphilus]
MLEKNLVKQGALFGGIYLLLLYLTILVPFIEVVTIFLLPIPFIIFSARHGWKSSSILLLIVLLFASIVAMNVSIPLTILTGFSGILIGSAIHQKVTPYEVWAKGTLGFVLGFVFIYIFVQVIFTINLSSEFQLIINDSIATSEEMMEQFGLETSTENHEMLTQQMEQFLNLLPVILVIVSMILGFITQWLGFKVLNRLDGLGLRFPPFRDFVLPKVIIWVYFIAILFTWFNIDSGSPFYQVIINVTNLVGLLITLQGFSFILYYTYTKKLTKAIPIITILVAILLPFIGLYMMRILGIIDLGFSLRDRLSNAKK